MSRLVAPLVLLLLVLAPGLAVPANAADKVALVMGNAAYPGQGLRNPVNDARAMGASLQRSGFEVVQLTDGTQQAMQRAVGQFSRKLRGAHTALVYYSGHGIQAQGINYMIPIDAEIESEGDMPLQLVSVDAVMAQLVQAGTDVNILILDACRTNPFERRFRAMAGAGLAAIMAPKGTVIAYATAPGTTASDGDGPNSPYTTALLQAMAIPGQKIEDVFKLTRSQLARATDNRQISWESSSLIGDFYFTGPVAAPSASPVLPVSAPASPAPHSAAAVPPAAAPVAPSSPSTVASIWGRGTGQAAAIPDPTPVPPGGIGSTGPWPSAPGTAAVVAERPAGKLKLDIVNDTKWTMSELYLSPSEKTDWEDNVLEGQTLEPGETLALTVTDGSRACLYDFRAIFSEKRSRESTGINICTVKTYNIR